MLLIAPNRAGWSAISTVSPLQNIQPVGATLPPYMVIVPAGMVVPPPPLAPGTVTTTSSTPAATVTPVPRKSMPCTSVATTLLLTCTSNPVSIAETSEVMTYGLRSDPVPLTWMPSPAMTRHEHSSEAHPQRLAIVSSCRFARPVAPALEGLVVLLRPD